MIQQTPKQLSNISPSPFSASDSMHLVCPESGRGHTLLPQITLNVRKRCREAQLERLFDPTTLLFSAGPNAQNPIHIN